MSSLGEAVYCTLLITDDYLPGAVVLAHSLRDNGTRARLVALFTPETLKESTIKELQSVYDEIIPVPLITNSAPANLYLMDRPDLISAFTKIELWRQTQFSKIVYIDADVVALRAPDELLSLGEDFAAAPDIGWPDIFNSGVMVLRPNMQDYYSLCALAESGTSFDGADQGLLNMHFNRWHRLSFTYNCTPSGNYQYLPAYKHFESTISLIHFIGSQKPWNQSRHVFTGNTPYYQLLGRWWATYDRHYRPQPLSYRANNTLHEPLSTSQASISPSSSGYMHTTSWTQPSLSPSISGVSSTIPSYSKNETREQIAEDLHVLRRSPVSEGFDESKSFSPPELVHPQPVHSLTLPQSEQSVPEPKIAVPSVVPLYVQGEEQSSVFVPVQSGRYEISEALRAQFPQTEKPQVAHISEPEVSVVQQTVQHVQPTLTEPPVERPFSPPKTEWDARREPPPLHSKPEAVDLRTQTYTMSDDTQLFQPPSSYPEAPKDMYYEVPARKPEPQKLAQIFPWETRAPKPSRIFADEPAQTSAPPDPETDGPSQPEPASPETSFQSDLALRLSSWESYSRSNAWDEVPEIERYVEAIQRPKTGNSSGTRRSKPSLRITDFPTVDDRPSLPVTPAPVRRSFWGPGAGGADEFPVAEGVPDQEDWELSTHSGNSQNPLAQLEELQKRQSELFAPPTVLSQNPPELSDETEQSADVK
ncbi:uncharacterized protein TRUGW13939_03725 [Talaromyces rugulosus]|uniref:glycogenin glucosyltransferase n=1 Tax=Talaromyces rugulosus TaxID=121627 RepID=A0A7H8QRL8_TALRU|nr:uncharacterized protein TRUGW13939_03725 [Talaromyces rugulosus]QKX56620.1 hypothetical protein TRUGW13939_03725 [Talaromyces rugulosus]